MNEPDISSSPDFFGMTSDSPVMRLSFAEQEPCSTTLSEGTWSPRPSSITSSSTSCSTGMSSRVPLRTTWARVDVMTLSWSIIILARISWKMPMTVLATMTVMNTRLLYAPVRKMATPRMTFTKLNKVHRLSLKMRPMLLEVTSVLTFTLPAATRSVTCAEVRPVSLAASFCSIAFMPTMIAVS